MATSNSAALAQRNARRATVLRREITRAQRQSENAIFLKAQDLSSGTTPTATLSKPPPGLNRPYGRGRSNRLGPRGPIPNGGNPGIINQQTGTFKASWDAIGFSTKDMQVIVLRNTAPYAANMLGTKLMIERPILALVVRSEYPAFVRRFRQAQQRALATR